VLIFDNLVWNPCQSRGEKETFYFIPGEIIQLINNFLEKKGVRNQYFHCDYVDNIVSIRLRAGAQARWDGINFRVPLLGTSSA